MKAMAVSRLVWIMLGSTCCLTRHHAKGSFLKRDCLRIQDPEEENMDRVSETEDEVRRAAETTRSDGIGVMVAAEELTV